MSKDKLKEEYRLFNITDNSIEEIDIDELLDNSLGDDIEDEIYASEDEEQADDFDSSEDLGNNYKDEEEYTELSDDEFYKPDNEENFDWDSEEWDSEEKSDDDTDLDTESDAEALYIENNQNNYNANLKTNLANQMSNFDEKMMDDDDSNYLEDKDNISFDDIKSDDEEIFDKDDDLDLYVNYPNDYDKFSTPFGDLNKENALGDSEDMDNSEENTEDDIYADSSDESMNSEENDSDEDPNFAGNIRTVRGACLVYKRNNENNLYDELWIFSSTGKLEDESKIRRAILAGTDINPATERSTDDEKEQYSETTKLGDVIFLKIFNLPN